jgi:hypothetical protein
MSMLGATPERRHTVRLHPQHPDISTYDARRFENALTIGEDGNAVRRHARALGVMDMSVNGRPVVTGADHARIEASLLGRAPDRRMAVLRSLHDATRHRALGIDVTALMFLDSLALDLPTMLLMGVLCDMSSPSITDGLQFVSADGTSQAWLQNDHALWAGRKRLQVVSASIAPGADWSDGGVDLERGMLPDTLVAAIHRRRLSEVVSHPILDPLDLTIEHVADNLGWPRLVTDHKPDAVRIDVIAQSMIDGGDAYGPFRGPMETSA